MKEIIQLIRELKDYPPNFFAYPTKWQGKNILVICDKDGNKAGFIKTGGEEGVMTE